MMPEWEMAVIADDSALPQPTYLPPAPTVVRRYDDGPLFVSEYSDGSATISAWVPPVSNAVVLNAVAYAAFRAWLAGGAQ